MKKHHNGLQCNNYKKKDLSVELLRIIGALMVIGTHSKQGLIIDGSVSATRVLIACMVGDGVAVFWMIAGFFLPAGPLPEKFYQNKIKRSVRSILMPMIILTLVTFFFSGWLLDGLSLSESIHHSKEQYLELIKGFLQWKNTVNLAGHMWYMYTYFLVILVFPMIWGIIFLTHRSLKSYLVLPILWIILLLNDIFHNDIFHFSHYSINALSAAIIYIITGNILYQWHTKFVGKLKYIVLGLAMIICSNLIRGHFQCEYLRVNPDDKLLLFWFTSFAFINVIGIVILTWGCIGFLKNRILFQKILYHVGGRTMMIYLIHYLILQKTRNLGFPAIFKNVLGTSLKGSLIYQITYTIMIFGLALFVAEILYWIRDRGISILTMLNTRT